MRKIICTLLLFFLSPSYGADSCQALFESVTIERNQIRPLVFTKTEVLRRNNDIGQQQLGELRLEKWFEIPPYDQGYYNFVGLTGEGKVYHVIDWNGERRMARLLSGQKSFEELVLVNGKILLALDSHGKVFIYSPELWRKSPLRTLIKRSLQIQGGLFAILTSTFYAIAPQSFEPAFAPFILGTAGALSSLQAGFWALFKYEKLNTFPDGFRETQWDHFPHDMGNDMLPLDQSLIPQPYSEATEDIR